MTARFDQAKSCLTALLDLDEGTAEAAAIAQYAECYRASRDGDWDAVDNTVRKAHREDTAVAIKSAIQHIINEG